MQTNIKYKRKTEAPTNLKIKLEEGLKRGLSFHISESFFMGGGADPVTRRSNKK